MFKVPQISENAEHWLQYRSLQINTQIWDKSFILYNDGRTRTCPRCPLEFV